MADIATSSKKVSPAAAQAAVPELDLQQHSPLDHVLAFCINQKPVIAVLAAVLIAWGVLVAPFNWSVAGIPRDPVPVDAIPDLGENQQIVFAEWPGRSPEDIDDQVSYPLTVALYGMPGVKDVRSYSIFGFSTIYVIFNDDVDFYWARSRILEKLNSLPSGTLPPGVQPALGSDATALGQVYWYTLEGRDPDGNPTGGWDLQELRSIQDFVVRYRIAGVEGVAEVASIGGFVREYQVDVDPDAMRAADVSLSMVLNAVRRSNVDVSARTIEVNRAEYVIRGVGRIDSLEDIEQIPVGLRDDTPILLADIATVSHGPALRRGALTKAGAEAVGGVVVVRYGENPMAVIERVKAEIEAIGPGLPTKVLADGTLSRVTIVPFYDRTHLINETLGTLESAIVQQILVTLAVVVLMVMHLRSSLLISSMLPLTVLMTFIGMKLFGVDANLVALAGIAIAVGTVVDMGIVLTENIVRRLDEAPAGTPRSSIILSASSEVGGAVLTAVLTTVVSFLPVFTMEASEGKLFKPLAWTKTLALLSSIFIALIILPAVAHLLFRARNEQGRGIYRWIGAAILVAAGGAIAVAFSAPLVGGAVAAFGLWIGVRPLVPRVVRSLIEGAANVVAVAGVLVLLAVVWEPLGPDAGDTRNLIFVVTAIAGVVGTFLLFRIVYPFILGWCLRHKIIALTPSAIVVLAGLTIWLGFDRIWGWLPENIQEDERVQIVEDATPGLGREFMPALDEGSFLYMPTTMVHASIGEALDILKLLDKAIMSVPEVELAVGKIGRVESALDPAPVSMVETIIEYRSEYISDENGRRKYFAWDPQTGQFELDADGHLIEDEDGRPFRQWRPHIQSPDD
ncbi:MAG: efflux RND transporter permease subunit, partial [Planctomycetota bacterium]